MRRDALVVGINRYPSFKDTLTKKAKHLTTPASDAEAVAQLLERYGEFQVQRLLALVKPQSVKLEELKEAITELFHPQSSQVPETAVLFFAGHGLRKSSDDKTEGYLATSDTLPQNDVWGLSLKWLRQILQESPVRQQIIWLDCCHSGELLNFAETDLGEYEKGRDRCFIVASRDFQVAYAEAEGKHGVLSGALLRGLDPTLQQEKWVTNFTLVDFVKQALKDAPQHPICTNFGGQIILTGKQSLISTTCPYKGLAYFDWNDEDPKYFHGRTPLTNQLLEKVRHSNFLAVLGASGSGKSSVVRAGLLHQLKLGVVPGSDRWKIYEPFTPGEHPLESLEQVIGVKADQLQALMKAAAAERVVLVVDQFEEAFTQRRDDAERQKFFECLLSAVERLGNKFCLVLVMRADFQGKCGEQEYGGLAAKIDQNLVRVMPMNQQELREAIIKPAEQVGLEIDRELVHQMIADVSGSPGDLPLLQYTLTELWKQRTLNRLTINDYTRLGGVKKALEKHANEVYKSLSAEEQLVAKQIFLELTHLGEGTEDTRRQVRQQDLVTQRRCSEGAAARTPELVERVIQCLAKEKLVVTGEQEFEGKRLAVVNIAHEALIRNWDLLSKWLKENREALLRKQDIEDAAREWRDKGKSKDAAYLLQGERLKSAERFCQQHSQTIPLSKIAEDFVQASQVERERRKKRTLVQVSGTLLGALVLTVFGWWQWQYSIINDSRNLVTSSSKLLESNQSFEALIASLKASKQLKKVVLDTSNIRRQLVDQLQLLAYKTQGQAHKPIKLFQPKEPLEVFSHLAVNIDSQQLILAGQNSTVQLRELSGEQIVEFPTNQGWINDIYFSPDKRYLITVGSEETLRLWNFSGKQVTEFQKDIAPFNSVAFTLDQKLMATISRDGTARLWDSLGSQIMYFNVGSAKKAILSPDGKYLATSSKDFTHLWDLSGKKLSTFLGGSVVFSPDSQYLATLVNKASINDVSQSDLSIRLWNLSGKQLALLKENGSPSGVVFSPDSKKLISFAFDRFAQLRDLSGKQLASFRTDAKWFQDFTFSPSGQQLVSTDFNLSIQLWDLFGKEITGVGQGCFEFSPDKKHFITCGGNSTTILWNFLGKQIAEFIPATARDTIFSKDGRQVAILGDDGALRLWNLSEYQQPIFQANKEAYIGLKLSPNSKYVVDSTKDGIIRIQNLSGTQVQEFKAHQSGICQLVFSPDSRLIASTTNEGDIRIWDLYGKQIAEFKVEPGFFQCNVYDPADKYAELIFNPNGQQLAAIGSGGQVRLWDISGQQKLEHLLDVHPVFGFRREFRWHIAFSPDGKRLTVAGGSDKAKIWDTSSGTQVAEFQVKNSEDILPSLIYSPDNKYLVVNETNLISLRDSDFKLIQEFQGNADNLNFSFSPDSQQFAIIKNDTVSLWNLIEGKAKEFRHHKRVSKLLFRPDSKQFVTVENNKVIRLWDLSGKQETQLQLKNSTSSIGHIKFSPNGKLLAIATDGSSTDLQLWDVTSGKQIVEFPEGQIDDIIFSPDSKQLAAIKMDGSIRFWLVKSYDELVAEICNKVGKYLKDTPKKLTSEDRRVCDI